MLRLLKRVSLVLAILCAFVSIPLVFWLDGPVGAVDSSSSYYCNIDVGGYAPVSDGVGANPFTFSFSSQASYHSQSFAGHPILCDFDDGTYNGYVTVSGSYAPSSGVAESYPFAGGVSNLTVSGVTLTPITWVLDSDSPPHTGGYVYYSVDGGSTWTVLDYPAAGFTEEFLAPTTTTSSTSTTTSTSTSTTTTTSGTSTTLDAMVAIASGGQEVAPGLLILGAGVSGAAILILVVRWVFGFVSGRRDG